MPNICLTDICFIADKENRETLIDFYRKLSDGYSLGYVDGKERTPAIGDDCYKFRFLGRLQEIFNFKTKTSYYRGWVEYISDIYDDDYGNTSFTVEVEDAWDPHIGIWYEAILKHNNAQIQIKYRAMEEGMGLYQTNDMDYFNVGYTINAYLSFRDPENLNFIKECTSLYDRDGIFYDFTKAFNRGILIKCYLWSNASIPIDPIIEYRCNQSNEMDLCDQISESLVPVNTLSEIAGIDGISINEYTHVDVVDQYESDLQCYDSTVVSLINKIDELQGQNSKE